MEERPVDRYRRTLRQHLPELAAEYHVRTLEVFGSYVRDEQTPESDLDVLVTFDKTPDLLKFINLYAQKLPSFRTSSTIQGKLKRSS